MSKKLFIKTMGCQMNEYDSDKMADVLRESHGFELTDNPNEADLLLANTCSIREKAQEKVFSELGRWRARLRIKTRISRSVSADALQARKARALRSVRLMLMLFSDRKPCTACRR